MQLFMLPQLRSMSQLYTVFPEGNRRTEESCHDKRFQAFDVFGATAKKWCMPWTSAISVVFQKSFRIRYSIMAAARCVCVCASYQTLYVRLSWVCFEALCVQKKCSWMQSLSHSFPHRYSACIGETIWSKTQPWNLRPQQTHSTLRQLWLHAATAIRDKCHLSMRNYASLHTIGWWSNLCITRLHRTMPEPNKRRHRHDKHLWNLIPKQ